MDKSVTGTIFRQIYSWLKALHPLTFVIPLVSCAVGLVFAAREGRISRVNSTLIVLAGVFLQAGVNLVNTFFEIRHSEAVQKQTERVFGPQRKKIDWIILLTGLGFFLMVFPIGLFLFYRTGLIFLIFALIALISGYFYAGEPFLYKKRSFAVPFIFFFMGVLMVTASYYAAAFRLSLDVLWISLPVSFLVGAILLSEELRDYEQDGWKGHKTLSIRIGYLTAVGIFFAFLIAAYVSVFILRLFTVIHSIGFIFIAVPFLIPPLILLFRANRDWLIRAMLIHHAVFGICYCLEISLRRPII